MEEKEVTINNKYGLHSRPASALVKKASNFDSEIKLIYDGKEANTKSILGLMVLAIEPGAEVKIIAEGEDEKEALEELEELIENDFFVEYDDEDN